MLTIFGLSFPKRQLQQHALQPHARRVLVREPQSRLLLAPLSLRSHASGTSLTPLFALLEHAIISLLQGLSPLFNLPFLSSPLAYVPIYFWSRRHPSTPISLFGLLTITAPYLPFALVAFSWVLSGTWRAAASDLVGCAVGHVGWFIRDVWTREMVGGSTILSEAPEPLLVYFFSGTPHRSPLC